MNTSAVAWMEFGFDLFYFVVLGATVAAMAVALPRIPAQVAPMAKRVLLAFVLLGVGDLGHVGLRILAQLWMDPFSAWVPWGAVPTAITVTFFYLLLLDALRVRRGAERGPFDWALIALAALRFVLLAAPGNAWEQPVPPLGWSLARNVPLFLIGVAVMGLFLRDGKRSHDPVLTAIGGLIGVSYACYAPVILFVQQVPAIGLLMIPKTVAYLAMGVVAYRGLFRSSSVTVGTVK